MRTLVRLLLCTAFASTTLAQSQGESYDSDGASYSESESDSDSSDSTTGYIYIDRPTQGEVVPTDAFTLEWSYDFDYTGDFTVELLPMGATAMDNSVFSTTVFALDGSTVLPGSVLPSIQPSQSAAFSVWVYTDDAYGGYGTYVDQVLLQGVATATDAPTTVTHTVEVEATSTAETVGEEGIVQTQQSDGDDGLSTGAKAGIGVGVGAGALILVAIIGFFLYRRRRQPENQRPKTIREISTIGPGSVSAEFANANANGGDPAVYTGNAFASELHADSDTRAASLPMRSPLSDAGSNSVSGMGSVSARHSGERERERYELGG